jgi:hypothetical protein
LAYFVSFQQAAKDFAQLSQTKLTMPVLAIGGEKANGTVLGVQMKLVATNAKWWGFRTAGIGCWKKSPRKPWRRCWASCDIDDWLPGSDKAFA